MNVLLLRRRDGEDLGLAPPLGDQRIGAAALDVGFVAHEADEGTIGATIVGIVT